MSESLQPKARGRDCPRRTIASGRTYEKRADSDAKKSGPIGKTVDNVKSGYHKNRSRSSADKAKKALKDAG